MMVHTSGMRMVPVPFNEKTLNDSEQDANSVLTELDKGLRSGRHSLQCEAIVRFPRLFEKYPFPILINSSFLKLSEFFWNGSNLLRFWVLRVCQQSEKHLDKILNIDAFVKRISIVIHANDPVARALTLRTLGAMARVIPEKQQVHHAIRRALDSHNTVEVEAAIYASAQFAAQSRSFAISMCSKISDMIESLMIPVPMKLKLIPVLRHMHHDSKTAALVKELCTDLLPKYPAESFVVAILDTLTQLSARTLTVIGEQVVLLLDFLADPRKQVRCQALQSLITLTTDQCVHAWPKTALPTIIDKAIVCVDGQEQYMYLTLVLKLTGSPLMCHMLLEKQAQVVELCLNCICLDDYNTASHALHILAALAEFAHSDYDRVKYIMAVVSLHMEGLVFCTIGDEAQTKALRQILICGLRISSVNREFRNEFTPMIAEFLNDEDVDYPAANMELICYTLAALSSQFQLEKFTTKTTPTVDAMEMAEVEEEMSGVAIAAKRTDTESLPDSPSQDMPTMLDHLPLILNKVNEIVKSETLPEQQHSLETLLSVSLLTMIGCFIPKNVIEIFERCRLGLNCWSVYKLARSASRYGQHYLAAHILTNLSHLAIIDKFHFFLTALAQMERAECLLNYCVEYEFMEKHYESCQPDRIVAERKSSAQPKGPPPSTPAKVRPANDSQEKIEPEPAALESATAETKAHDAPTPMDLDSPAKDEGVATKSELPLETVAASRHANLETSRSDAVVTSPEIPMDTSSPPPSAPVADTKEPSGSTCGAVEAVPLMRRLEIAINLYWQSLTSLRASSSPAHPLTFQLEFIKLRAQFLQTLHIAMTVKNGQVIVPPPAIAGSLAQSSRDYLQKFGHVTNQLRKLVKAAKSCADGYSRLYKSAFDADPATLEFLEICEYQCALFAHLVETICFVSPCEPPAPCVTATSPETRYLVACCKRIEKYQSELPEEPANAKTISTRHLEIVISVIDMITRSPLCLPRSFFQVLQSTQIKLSVSPQPRGPGEPVIVQFGSNLVIKVEGVIQHFGKTASLVRTVDAVLLSLSAQLMAPRNNNNSTNTNNAEPTKPPPIDNVTLTQTVKPQRDFISGSFLLPISSGGQWQVTLETSVIDENGMTWCTGPKNSMVVLMDDATKAATSSSRRF